MARVSEQHQSGEVRSSPQQKGVYFVKGQEWRVGERYELLDLLGNGTFSSVCRALDTLTGEQVALKRIPDVLSSPELTRRVVREVCILRRLDHPFIISLRDAFVRPSSSGPMRLVDGQLQSASLDVYIAMELAHEGDIFSLRGQLSEDEVRALMWQMLQALQYLHGVAVWHRDLKSPNVLLTNAGGHRIIKVADFGSARSAKREGYGWAEQERPELGALARGSSGQLQGDAGADAARPTSSDGTATSRPSQSRLFSQNSLRVPATGASGGAAVNARDLYVLVGQDSRSQDPSLDGAGVGYQSPLTVMVATPCYRAPEVVMSRGGYTSAIDMWSLGCIFGELLQRVRRVGSASTPHLHVAPMFAIHGLPSTPKSGEKFEDDAPANPTTRSELAALFSVIGSPAWADVARVPSPAWRKYLHKCPGRPPSLFSRFCYAGEASVHLLERLLAFDPERRCSAEEALQHEYFSHLDRSMVHDAWHHAANAELDSLTAPTHTPTDAERAKTPRTSLDDDRVPRWTAVSGVSRSNGASNGASNGPIRERVLERSSTSASFGYMAERDAATALHLLEDEMACLDCSSDGENRLRMLLERECDAQAREGAIRLLEQQAAAGVPQSDALRSYATMDGQPISTRFLVRHIC
ncbi:hypothetical protein WJX73_009498 [Symbiochloris irregularis]|uniref:Protein kinase domain-containing protein n=1 Tax=Symbiochloris irregularis TaxID=706552 RepID=A0AAW1NWL8_9CHLO